MNCLNPSNPHVAPIEGYQEHWAIGTTRKVAYVTLVLFVGLGVTGALLTQPGSVLFIVSVSGGGGALLALIPLMIWSVIIIISECKRGDSRIVERGPPENNSPHSTVNSEDSLPHAEAEKSSEYSFQEHLDGATPKNISTLLKQIPRKFFQDKSQERAKVVFSDAMEYVFGTRVDFPKAELITELDNDALKAVELNPEVFHSTLTLGVEKDIPRSSKDKDHSHIYQVASQYNAAEAPSPYTPHVGEAMKKSAYDHTQGPLAQRTNPVAFELVTAFLTHLGFNMLNEALPLAGETYKKTSSIQHGYLRPNSETIKDFEEQLRHYYHLAEYVCYESLSPSWGENTLPVKLFLQAAPAIGYSKGKLTTDELEKYAALANYTALFKYGIECAEESKMSVVLHLTAVGGGVFGNKPKNLAWGLKQAGVFYQDKMRKLGVKVQLENYADEKAQKGMRQISELLEIKEGDRIGDPTKS